MPENFESMPRAIPEQEAKPSAEPKKEKFSDFHLEVGDRIYNTTGKYYEVRRIEHSVKQGGREKGSVALQGYDAGKMVGSEGDMSFKDLLQWQENIVYIDQPRLPEGKTLEDYAQAGRLKAAFMQIAESLKDPHLPRAEMDRLQVAKANLIREILAAQEEDENTVV